jgi:hypothetical protein
LTNGPHARMEYYSCTKVPRKKYLKRRFTKKINKQNNGQESDLNAEIAIHGDIVRPVGEEITLLR